MEDREDIRWWNSLSEFAKSLYLHTCNLGDESNKSVKKMYKFYLKQFEWKRSKKKLWQ